MVNMRLIVYYRAAPGSLLQAAQKCTGKLMQPAEIILGELTIQFVLVY
jgi:hypothetical protein